MRFKVVIEEDKMVGGYVVGCPVLLGCHSPGDKNTTIYITERGKNSSSFL